MEGLSHILKLQGIPSLQENLQELILSIRHIWMRPEVRVPWRNNLQRSPKTEGMVSIDEDLGQLFIFPIPIRNLG